MQRFGKLFWFLAVCPMLFGFDWCTKEAARSLPVGGQVSVVPGWMAFQHAENPYIAFSIPIPLAVTVTFGLIAIGVLAFTLWALDPGARVQAVALGTITAGALGNWVDRLVDGSVTDFVRVYTDHPALAPWLIETFGTTSWPIFNVADACLLGGVALWLVHDLVRRDPEGGEDDPEELPA
jgi:signal peptidase II